MSDAPNYLLLLPGEFPGCDPIEIDRCRTLADEPVVPTIYKKVKS